MQLYPVNQTQEEEGATTTEIFDSSLLSSIIRSTTDLKDLLNLTALSVSNDLELDIVEDIVSKLKEACLEGNLTRLEGEMDSFTEHAEHVQEICRLLSHICPSEDSMGGPAATAHLPSLAKSYENTFSLYWPQIMTASQVVSFHPANQSASSQLDILLDSWISLVTDVYRLSLEVKQQVLKMSSTPPTSILPSPHHGVITTPISAAQRHPHIHPHARHRIPPPPTGVATSFPPLSSSHLPPPLSSATSAVVPYSQQKRVTIQEEFPPPPYHHYPSGHHLYYPSSPYYLPGLQAPPPSPYLPRSSFQQQPAMTRGGEEEAEGEEEEDVQTATPQSTVIPGDPSSRWPDTKDNDIVKRAKAMTSMAYTMFQFTQGEGELKTTQDLFTQAEFFAEEANKFYKVVRHFTYQVGGPLLWAW